MYKEQLKINICKSLVFIFLILIRIRKVNNIIDKQQIFTITDLFILHLKRLLLQKLN